MTAIRRTLALLLLPTAAVVAFAGPAAAATFVPQPTAGPIVTTAPAPATAQGIIMRDGGICDPIRHMGC
jgi:hypothetical protein